MPSERARQLKGSMLDAGCRVEGKQNEEAGGDRQREADNTMNEGQG